jgi:hypothetical protein
MPSSSGFFELSVYNGRELLGFIEQVRDGRWRAIDANGDKVVGVFPTMIEASRAFSGADRVRR